MLYSLEMSVVCWEISPAREKNIFGYLQFMQYYLSYVEKSIVYVVY